MKKIAIVGSVVVIMALVALPVMAKGPGGGQGRGQGQQAAINCPGPGFGNLTEEQATALQESRQKFFNETKDLREGIQLKRAELRALMLNKEAKEADILAKNKELRELTNQMSEKRILHRLELRKQFPELGLGFGGGQGRGWHRGPGQGMGQGTAQGRGWNRGSGNGVGGGYCWR